MDFCQRRILLSLFSSTPCFQPTAIVRIGFGPGLSNPGAYGYGTTLA